MSPLLWLYLRSGGLWTVVVEVGKGKMWRGSLALIDVLWGKDGLFT